MRSSFLVPLFLCTALSAQEIPVITPEVPRGPDRTLPVPPMVDVPVRAKVDRYAATPKDHVVLFITGDVLLAGDRDTGSLVLRLER
ncbi:MAG: hypothetical protein IPP83_09365 [Flavobacteriales bacterium]|nr:hypothetical protein [Flavobacteriales bacterium]